jgi:gliding motility-associated-like protein
MGQVPVAGFSSSSVSGCAALVIDFKDQSTGSPKFWNWDFGNGQLSNLQNPTVVFTVPGTYSITLVVRNNDGTNAITKTDYVTVNPSPQANFSADKTLACAPFTIQFTDLSVPNAGTIVSWLWTFGDGSTSTLQNPQKQFTVPGFYDIGLTVKSSTGCQSGAGIGRYIRIVSGVTADFSFTLPNTCRPPFAANFTNLTSGPGNLTYAWDFGNATTSAQTDPAAAYNNTGTYTVKLTAQSDYGCQDIIQKPITINGTTTSFNSPDSTCLNTPVNFQNTSSPVPLSSSWNFGDGTQSTQVSPSKAYSSPGLYNITLNSKFANCIDSATKSIIVYDKPVVDFNSPKAASCKAPLAVTFQDISPDAVNWQWNFGDGATGTGKTASHTYNTAGQYNVTLTITDSKGCQNTIIKNNFIQIIAPSVSISNTPAGGCAPFTFTPVAGIGAVDGVASYLWDFGDAGATSTSPNPSHTYNSTGNYTVKLTITTNDGCSTSVTSVNAVKVGTPAVVDFSASPNPVCAFSAVNFTDLSNTGDTWLWDFGDGTPAAAAQNPSHTYLDTGLHNISLTVTNNGCPVTVVKNGFVRSLPPVADFNFAINCASKRAVAFTNLSKTDAAYGPVSYLWEFGDPGNATDNLLNTSFTYPAFGTYTVKLTTFNGGCSHQVTKQVKLINETADFSISKPIACRNDVITFTAINSNPANIVKYEWSINGGTPVVTTASSYATGFSTTGSFAITLTLTDINGCTDTKTINNAVNITGPTALFTTNNNGGCKSTSIQFNDASISTGTIIKWTWDFGDGTIKSYTTAPFTHIYADTGTYTVKLTILDNIGCSDTYTLTTGATVTKPTARFGAEKTLFCPATALQFRDSSIGNSLTYAWSFGDGATAAIQNPTHAYPAPDSIYSVKLVVTDAYGCSDSATRNNYISIKGPKALFGVKDSTTICPPLETQFFFKGQDYESFFWDFGDGGSSSQLNPRHFYNTYGAYTVKLYVTGYGGCIDSASSIVNVYNPYSTTTITYSPVTACNELTVNFSVTPTSSTRFQFYFGDGSVDSSQQQTFQHFYNLPNFYSPFVLLADSVGCLVVVGGPSTIRVLGAVPLFGVDRKKFCDSGTVFFTDYSQGIADPIVSKTWDFGDGNTSTAKDAIHFYSQPGLYTPSLTVVSQAGCTKTLVDTIRVLGTPHPVITSVDVICNNLFVNFNGTPQVPPDTAIAWKWDFGDGQASDQQNVQIKYANAGNYTIHLTATNSLGCKDTVSKGITVYPLPAITITGDTSLIVGTGITIPLTYSPNVVSYNWTPPLNLSCTDCPNPFANPKFTTTYKVTVNDSNGCVSSRNVTVLVLCNNKNFFIPNTFSPNNDGSNDWFYPRGTGIDRIQAMRIFNRWGELVYEKKNFPANDFQSGWNGMYKGKPAGVDTYVYMIDIICENAAIITYKGNVTLIR